MLLSKCRNKWKIFSNFLAFLQSLNFMKEIIKNYFWGTSSKSGQYLRYMTIYDAKLY